MVLWVLTCSAKGEGAQGLAGSVPGSVAEVASDFSAPVQGLTH